MLSHFFKKYPEALFLTKLLSLFSVSYFGTEFWIGITAKGGLYSPFCDTYLNYIQWLRLFILKGAAIICSGFGYSTTIINTISLKIIGGMQVNMVYSCTGYGVLSCWTAFVLVYPSNSTKKIIWLFTGALIICFANMIRVAGLLILVNKTNNANSFPNHHTVFNVAVYSIIFTLIYFYTKGNKQIAR
ncbi:MAG: exosortase/archaeosortase family protein [Chitinophagaceae bacterium]